MAISDRLSALTPEQRALFEKLREQQKKQKPSPPKTPQPPPVLPRGPGEHWPLSFDQERLWFLYMLNPEDSAYNIDTASRIRGRVDFAALRGAFQEIARRHEIWRTAFPAVDGRPVQVVLPEMYLPNQIVDLRTLPRELREPTAHGLMVDSTRVPFQMETGPLVRALLLRLDDEDCICHLIVHHIVTDWVTFQLFWREIGLLYEASIAGRPSPLPPPVVQFADYTAWQREWMSGEVEQFFLRYWVERLRDAPLALEVPTDRPRPPVQTSNGWRVEVRVERAAEVKSLARREGLTPFMAMLAAYQLVLSRWSGQDKIIVGSPNANRNRLEIQEIFGFFLTQLPFCNDFSGEPTLREALRRTRDMALAAYAHQDLPFGKLVEALHPERDLSRAPIIQVVLLLLDGAVLSPKLADLALEPVDIHDGNARYDVMFAMWDHPDLIHGWYEYNSDLWDEPTAARLVQGFNRVLDAMIADPESRLADLTLVSPAEAHQVLAEWNDTAAEYPAGTLHGLIAARAAQTPEALAAAFEGESLTYAELESRAGRLAHHLIRLGVAPDARVGVLMERSLEMIVGLLGILKAGAAYVPLDPTYPAERLALMVESAGMSVVLAEERFTHLLPTDSRLTVLSPPLPEGGEGMGEGGQGGEGSLAYVIYTSGSTGTPKGVMIPHRGIVNRLLWMQEAYGLTPEDRVLQKTPFGFDVSVWEFFWPLLAGARLVFARPEGHRDPVYLTELIAREGITTLHFVPSMLQLFLEAPGLSSLSSLRRVMVSGEALPPEMVRRFHALLPGVELHNLYGPTEASVDVSFWPAEQNPRRVPIGRPIANLRLHVADRDLHSQPIGVPGELLLGGVGLARGYLGRAELTAAAFVPDPFGAEPGGRLYRTGDLVRTWGDGNVEFLGRIDHQVKIRGVRIELGEVEAALDRHPAVGEAVAVARDGVLVAYVVGREPDPEELRRFLLERLPEPMVPSTFVVLDKLPLTASGKVDRRALPAPQAGRAVAAAAYEAPRNPDEELLVELWDKVLGTGRVGIRDHFFHLGGHSLLATRLTLYIRDAFQVDLPVRSIFQAPTVADQAELIAGLRAGGATVADTGPIPRLPRESWPLRAPLSFAQERLWFIDRLMPGNPAYNLGVALRLDGRLDTGALAAAFDALVERHETLRTVFPEHEGRPVQEVAQRMAFRLQEIDLSGAADPEEDVRRLAEADAVRPIDLAAGPMLRATVLRLDAERHVLLLAMHHIVSDAWSMGVLIEDLTALYSGRQLAPLPVQYADYAVWQRERLSGAEIDRQLAFWSGQLASAPRVLDLPTDQPRPAIQSLRGGMVRFEIEAGTRAALADLARRTGSTLYMVLLSGWAALLARLSDQQDLVLGTAVANRDRAEVERLIGYFVNTLAMRIDLTRDPSFEELLGQLRHRVLDAFAHRDLPFEKLVEELRPARDRSRQPLFQVMLTFQNVPEGRADLRELALTPVEVAGQTTKFDLTLTLFEEGGHLLGRLEYASDLFEAATAERWTGAFRRLLAGAAAAPESRVADLPWVSAAEREQLLNGWNQVRNAASLEPGAGRGRRSLVALFEEQVDRRPDAPAVSLGAELLTYRELDERANRLARHLLANGVRPGDRVALGLERSLEMVVALLGVLKAGAAYVPLDPAYPAERLAFALEDSGAALVVTAGDLAGQLPVRALLLDREADAIARQSTARPGLAIDPEMPAYVIYTSGSTGRPKGVVVPHGNVSRLFSATEGWFGFGPEDVWTLFHSYAFDFSVWEIWGALLYGGRLVIVPFWASRTPESFLQLLHEERVTVLNQTPSAFRQLLWAEEQQPAGGEGLSLRQVIFGGEALEPAMLGPWFSRHAEDRPRLVNMYGITETTVHVTFRPLGAKDAAAPGSLIGQPIPDLTVHVLDRWLALQPVGVPGEICVGGEGLAQGYLGRPELTAERFVPDPWGAAGARLYRSGDLARRRPDGDLEYLGRIDQQVKIRGFRIEPGEVEAALAQHPAVRTVAVLPREIQGNQGGTVLVAYAVLAETVPATELQAFLRERLPEPMLPAAWVFLEALPLTPNGKVDRRALGALEVEAARSTVEHVAPRTPLEERLVEAVAGVLGLETERIGVYDNFFDLGGHSLLATQLVAQLRLQHGIDVPLQLLFDSAHLADLADRVTERELGEADDALLEEMLAELEESE
jgi:amino acid adenylation domain-containing protein